MPAADAQLSPRREQFGEGLTRQLLDWSYSYGFVERSFSDKGLSVGKVIQKTLRWLSGFQPVIVKKLDGVAPLIADPPALKLHQ